MSRSWLLAATLLSAVLLVQTLTGSVTEAWSQPSTSRQVAPLGASEGVAWYVDLGTRRIVACRIRSDPAALACSAHAMP